MQVDPWLTPNFHYCPCAWFQRSKVKYDKLLANFAFKCNLRHYAEALRGVASSGGLALLDNPAHYAEWRYMGVEG